MGTEQYRVSDDAVLLLSLNQINHMAGNKHTSECLQRAGDEEPIFVLRAQDHSSPSTILQWIYTNFENVPDDKLREAFEQAITMKHYPKRKQAD